MAYIRWNMFSLYLEGKTEVSMIIPDSHPEYQGRVVNPTEFYERKRKFRVLWLLHGTTGDDTDWIRMTNIETYALENQMVVVMPTAMNSNYTAWPGFGRGYDFPGYFFKELMPMVYSWLPVSDKPEDNFIAGDSMGGNGAFMFGVSHPELFAGVGVLSSRARNYDCQVEDGSMASDPKMGNSVRNAGGVQEFMASDVNIRGRLRELAEKDELYRLPPIYVCYGDRDPRMNMLEDFMNFCGSIGFKADIEIIPGYGHEFRLWDIGIQHAMKRWGFQIRE